MTIKIDPKPLRMLTTSMVARNRPGVYSLRDFCVSFETSLAIQGTYESHLG
jgi:hypothetical protein